MKNKTNIKPFKAIIVDTYGENFPSTNLNRPISYVRIGMPSHIWRSNKPERHKLICIAKNIHTLRFKNSTKEAYIPNNGSSIIASTHSYSRVERVNIQNIRLPTIEKSQFSHDRTVKIQIKKEKKKEART